jgi:co-chaperonin GroES (HSP10)
MDLYRREGIFMDKKDLPVPFLPNKDYVLVKRDEVKTTTDSGLILPESKDNPNHIGVVVASGGVSEEKLFNKISVGDKIAYRHDTYDIKIPLDGVSYDFVSMNSVHGTYGKLA